MRHDIHVHLILLLISFKILLWILKVLSPRIFFSKLTVLAYEFQQMVRKFNFSVIQRHYLHCKQPNRFTHKKGVRHFQIACHFYMVLQIDGSSCGNFFLIIYLKQWRYFAIPSKTLERFSCRSVAPVLISH